MCQLLAAVNQVPEFALYLTPAGLDKGPQPQEATANSECTRQGRKQTEHEQDRGGDEQQLANAGCQVASVRGHYSTGPPTGASATT